MVRPNIIAETITNLLKFYMKIDWAHFEEKNYLPLLILIKIKIVRSGLSSLIGPQSTSN